MGWMKLAVGLLSEYKKRQSTGCIVANEYCGSLSRDEHVIILL